MSISEMVWAALLLALVVVVALSLMTLIRERRGRAGEQATMADAARRLVEAQSELGGRLAQMEQASAAQQAELRKTLEDRLSKVSQRVGDNLREQTERNQSALKTLGERLSVIDAAQKNITELSGHVVGLQELLANKQARGAFGEVQLQDLVTDILPPSAYSFQAQVGGNRRVDCLLELPNPPGKIAIDAKFPLESYRALRAATDDAARTKAGRAFAADIMKHVKDIAERYIVPGETAESALMFLPSEAVYAELHANFGTVVEQSWKYRVWIVSPTTLMATLNTIRAVLKDAQMREQAGVIQVEVRRLLVDVGRLDDRVDKLQRHFGQVEGDIRQIRISTDKVKSRGERIEEVELGEQGEESTGPTLVEPPTSRSA